jgi:hypothetical protein
MVTGSIWSDVDRDGWVDLLLTREWGPVTLLKNHEGQLVDATQEAGLAGQSGWWNSISGGDLDHDGDMDFVAMNVGLNTKYHGDDQHPVVLFANDFDGNGTLDLVEAEYEGDICYPIRGRSCSSNAMPFLKEKFPTFHEFALADVGDIYTDESLDASSRFSANQLQSMLLINDGAGRFEMRALPRIAQISPGFGTVLQDFDGDGHLDLCIAQNFMNPQPETGQMDGGMGMLLRGDGQGNFRFLLPAESGIQVEGQGMALTVSDVNGDAAPDLFMSVNDAPARLWVNQSSGPRQRLAITLKSGSGNPSAIGSYVVLRNGSEVQACEVTAGSGYLSQSSPTIFVTRQTEDALAEVHIRWPDGSQETRTLPEGGPHLVIEQRSAVGTTR